MEWKSDLATYKLWLHLYQLADYAVVYRGILLSDGKFWKKKSKSTQAVINSRQQIFSREMS